jgi:hypothetical protein
MAEGAAIDADDEIVIARERRHGLLVGAIALVDPVGHVEGGARAHLAQPGQQEGGGGAPVDVIVGEDGDALAPLQGAQEAGRGLLHVAQGAGIGQEVAQGRGQEALGQLRRHLAAGQDLAE